jgi:hypothetical protein
MYRIGRDKRGTTLVLLPALTQSAFETLTEIVETHEHWPLTRC